MEQVSPSDISEIASDSQVTVLDLRSEEEFEENHISGNNIRTVNVYFHSLKEKGRSAVIERIDTEKVIVVCWAGNCSTAIARMLENEGFEAMSLEGGMQNWR